MVSRLITYSILKVHNHKTVYFFQLNVYIEFEYIFYLEDSDEEEERGKFFFNFYFGYYSPCNDGNITVLHVINLFLS